MTDPAGRARTPVSLARRVIVAVIVVSFTAAAISGIVVLLGAELGPTAWRVLSTTSVVGAFSVAVLCCVSLVGRRLQTFGYIGAGVSVVAAVLVLVALWGQPTWEAEAFWDALWTAVAASVAFSFASLLLLLADRRRTAVRVGLIVTLALFAIVFVMVIYPIWTDEYGGELYSRVLGIVSILAALGAIVLPVLSLLLREHPGREGGDSDDASLSPASLELLRAEAARRGVTPDELVDSLLRSGSLDPPPAYEPPPAYDPPPAYEPPPAQHP
jgi:peptidoglycan/LPS O-acetylase OafA/YrhL